VPSGSVWGIPCEVVTIKMDKKEINSPKLTANFLFWICGVGGLLMAALLGHYVWKIF
jgi:hypothetical protein